MKKLNKREALLGTLTALTALGALGYVYLYEPRAQRSVPAGSVDARYRECMDLLERRREIEARTAVLFSPEHWKETPQEQQVALQAYVEELTRSAGALQLMSIYPLDLEKKGRYTAVSLQLDVQGPVGSLATLLNAMGDSAVPLQIRKLQITGETAGNPELVRGHIEIASPWFPARSRSTARSPHRS